MATVTDPRAEPAAEEAAVPNAGRRPEGRRPRLPAGVAAGALALAALTWGLVWAWQYRRGAVQRHIEAGIEAAQSGQGEKAEQEWQTAVRLDPRNAGAWDLLGEYYLSTNNQPAAAAALRRALQLQPHTSKREGQLAEAALRLGDEVSALRYAQDALQDDPDNTAALSVAARLLGAVQDEKRRIDCLRRLVKLQPDDLSALSRLAVALSDNQLYREAGPVLAHILDLDPNSATAYALRGEMHLHLDTSPQGLAQAPARALALAQADFSRALQRDPTAPFPRFYLGKLYLRTGHPAKAVFQLEEAARLQPDKPEIYFELANAYRRAGRPQQADAARQRFASLSEYADLVSRLEKRCVVEPQNFAIHAQLGLLKLKAGDFRRAGFYLNTAHQIEPTDGKVNAALRQLATLSKP